VVNLSPQNSEILQRGKAHIKNSIAFCHDLRFDLLSFHAGSRAQADDMMVFPKADHVCDYQMAFQTLIDSVKQIDEYAPRKGVKIGVETNVVSSRNVVDGQNRLLLLCIAEELE
jgi:sugar phosphate isomerase/epimerase